MKRLQLPFAIFGICLILPLSPLPLAAGDWPMWRYDAGRTAAAPDELPSQLHLQWQRQYSPLEPAWEDPLNRDLMPFDRAYEPVVLGKLLFVGSNSRDCMIALDTETGAEKWTFYVDGPVRFPAVAQQGKIYFVSDDGHLYCLEAESGRLLWKFRGGPADGKILGNRRLVSTWPARGGPVFADGVVYFAAGIWPFMGVFIHALDAETGEQLWTNDSSGSLYILQPHNSPAYGGIAPQGNLVVAGDRLLVPGGRSAPACFDRHTGQLLYYHLARYNKTGGAFVCALGDRFVNYHRDAVTSLYDLQTGDALIPRFGRVPVATPEALFCLGDTVQAFAVPSLREIEYDRQIKDRKTGEETTIRAKKWVIDPLWECPVDASGDLIKAGDRLYAGGRGVVSAIDLVDGGKPLVVWQQEIDGTVAHLLSADDRLFAVTLEGRIYAFGGDPLPLRRHSHVAGAEPPDASWDPKARAILAETGVHAGYCLAYGLKDGHLIEALARNSDLHIIAVEPDPDKVEKLRQQWDAAGLYGSRIHLQPGELSTFAAPPYLASLTIFENLEATGYGEDKPFLERLYRNMRPYGGIACLPVDGKGFSALYRRVEEADLPGARLRRAEDFSLLTREGPLPGAADWTHQYGDIANTVKSDDALVRLPLGVLWFGGSSNMDVLPRHGHGPPEQVMGGRLFIEGLDSFSARDVYTGRVLWQRRLPHLGIDGIYYDGTYKDTPLSTAYNQVHIPGANARGTNFVVAPDKIYITQTDHCLVLDPVTGATLDRIELPASQDAHPEWGYIGVYKDYLIAGEGRVHFTDFLDQIPPEKRRPFYDLDLTSSRRLVVMDRHSGQVLWTYESALSLRHNAIAVGADRIFCIDAMPEMAAAALKRRGRKLPGGPRLLSLDVRTGAELWRNSDGIFGTWLSYSEEHDVLLQAGRKSRDTVYDEPDSGMVAFKGGDGTRLWRNEATYGGPVILHGEQIITDRYAYSLLTGALQMRQDPLTDAEEPWQFRRRYGCNYVVASEHMLTFRSAAAGFYDLENDGGTGNLGGFKSGCTSNLIAANGVLNAPDYTRTCACSYQNQTSLALIHMPEVEMWVTYSGGQNEGGIKSIGINLGAPGNRRGSDGRFWIAHPLLPHIENPEKEAGFAPDVEIEFNGPGFYTHHASRIVAGDGPQWVAASGCRGISHLELKLGAERSGTCAVTLHFAEPDHDAPGQRLFDVLIGGERRLTDFDIARQAGGRNRSLVKRFTGVHIDSGKVVVDFTPARSTTATASLPLLCGIEITPDSP